MDRFPENETDQEEAEKEPGTPFFRSFYKDYRLKEVTDGDGITRNAFVYDGALYELDAPGYVRLPVKLAHTLLLALTVLCVVLGNRESTGFNETKIYAFFLFLIVIMAVLRAFSILLYWIVPARMREWDYNHSVKYLGFYALVTVVCSAAVLIGGTVYALLHADAGAAVWSGLPVDILMLLSGLGARLMEQRLRFRVVGGELPARADDRG